MTEFALEFAPYRYGGKALGPLLPVLPDPLGLQRPLQVREIFLRPRSGGVSVASAEHCAALQRACFDEKVSESARGDRKMGLERMDSAQTSTAYV